MSVLFGPTSIEEAPSRWSGLITYLRSEVAVLGKTGLMAVMSALSSSGHNLRNTHLLVPSQRDKRYPELNPELGIELPTDKRRRLHAGVASLVLAQGVSRFLDHPTTSEITRDDGLGSTFMSMPVPNRDNTRAKCAARIDGNARGVSSFLVRLQPEEDGGLNRRVEVSAIMGGAPIDSRAVYLHAPEPDHKGQLIVMREGEITETFPTVRTASPLTIERMGQSLMIATANPYA